MGCPLTLPADPRAARRARAYLAQQLAGELVGDALESAKLLVSELVTNSLLHAASGVQVECTRAPSSVTVFVRDADTGPLDPGAAGTELAEGGRGLLLVDELSDAWGTEHSGGRKTVWFRMTRTASPAPRRDPGVAAGTEGLHDAIALRAAQRRLSTLVLPASTQRALTAEEHLRELLLRILEAVGATGGAVHAPAGQPLVSLGSRGYGPSCEIPLQFAEHPLGTLTVHADFLDDEDLAFLRLAAERLSVLRVQEHLVRSSDPQAAELDRLPEAMEFLAGASSTRSALALLTQLVIPRAADWSATYLVTERYVSHRVTANHRLEERLDPLLDALDGDPELDRIVQEAGRTGGALRRPLSLTIAGRRTSVVVLPLVSRARTLGVLVLGRDQPIDPPGLMHLLELCRRAAVAIDNARMHEEHVETSKALQSALLPPQLPDVDGVELAARYHSASPRLLVGGDFYDAFRLSDGSVICSIGDVCGKGAEAAAVTGMSRDLVRLLLRDGHSLVGALQRLNRALIEDGSSSRFCTIALARLSPSETELRVDVCLAGHPEPVVLRADGTTEFLGVPGDLLGVLPGDIDVTEASTTLTRDDVLVLYTDGITERRDADRMFGQEGLRRTLERMPGASAASLAEQVQTAAQSFVDSELRDDLALLVARRTVPRTSSSNRESSALVPLAFAPCRRS
jgi:phosphoserine phosphatase RsbU/P